MSMGKDFIAPIGVLTGLCVIVSASLAAVYGVTTPIIEKRKAEEADKARIAVLSSADAFTKVEMAEMPEGVVEIYEANNGAGFAVTAAGRGYGGEVVVMFGITSDSVIEKIQVLTHAETPGLGTKVVAEPSYLDQYNGKDSNLEGIESVGGATVSGNAVMSAARSAFQGYGAAAGVEVSSGPERAPIPTSALTELFPEVAEFTRLATDGEVYKAGDLGYVYASSEQGFVGPITMAIALDNNKTIIGATITEISETPGYGMKLVENDYLNTTYVGKTSADGLEVIAGATISSDAVNKIIADAFEGYDTYSAVTEGQVVDLSATASTEVETEVEETKDYTAVMAEIFPEAEFTAVEEGVLYKAGEAGYVYIGANQGFVGPIEAVIGMDNNGAITAIKITEITETDGFGMALTEESFLAGFAGKVAGDELEAIAGSTVSSDSFKKTIGEAFEAFASAGTAGTVETTTEETTETSTEASVDVVAEIPAVVSEILSGTATVLEADKMYKVEGAGYVYLGANKGFAGDMALAIAMDNTGAITKIVVTASNETVGYGAQLSEADFTDKYIGKVSGDELEMVAGSTVSSDAFNKTVEEAFQAYTKYSAE